MSEKVANTNAVSAYPQEATNALSLVTSQEGLAALKELPASQRVQALKSITSYIGAEGSKIDRYLGKTLSVIGCVTHSAKVRKSDENAPKAQAIVDENGELVEVPADDEYVNIKRTVFKLQDGTTIGFSAVAAEQFANDFLIPVFGIGDFIEDGQPVVVPIVVNQVSTKKGRTYTFQVV